MMKSFVRPMAMAVGVAVAAGGLPLARAQNMPSGVGQDAYVVTKLLSDQSGAATNQDSNLKNSWGVAFTSGGSAFWIADNNAGLSTLYAGDGTPVNIFPSGTTPQNGVVIPGPKGSSSSFVAAPTGIVWNPSSGFTVPGTSTPALFIFDTEDGTISAWVGGLSPANQAVLAVDNSQGGNGAVYKGLAFGVNVNGAFIFATNFRAGTIEVYDPTFKSATTDGGFKDPNIPAGYAPFGIQNINGDLFVTYALQNAQKHDDVAGPGHGFVDVFDTDGHLLQRFAQRGTLNSPWGVARASFAFGKFSGDILIGNFGDGRINVFDSQGHFIDQVEDSHGKPISIDGLWTLTLGGGRKSSSDTLYFTAGPNGETDGLFGTITPATGHGGLAAN
jgi:uncharacterized protein (TIGR03118 family)